MERAFDSLMFASRSIPAPICLGLGIALLLIGIKCFEEALHTIPLVLDLSEAD